MNDSGGHRHRFIETDNVRAPIKLKRKKMRKYDTQTNGAIRNGALDM